MRGVFSELRTLAAMLDVEAALARSQATLRLVPETLAPAIAAIRPQDLDLATLAKGTALAGVPVIPFVKMVQARLPAELESRFHLGTTTQDVADTALILQIRDALNLLETDLAAAIKGLATQATKHRVTPCVGRTAGQQAAPITFGYKAAGWCVALAEIHAMLRPLRARVLVVSLGGPVGTLSAFGKNGQAVLERFAQELDLRVPAIAWHTHRGRMAETGSWLCLLIGALAKLATDIVDLASTEVGEVSEQHQPGRGGSSAMPHKRNPVSSMLILSAHTAAAPHLVTLMQAMASLHERPVGAWHAEWHALPTLFGLAAGALREGRRLAEGLNVDTARMRKNIELTGGLLFSDVAAATLARTFGRERAHQAVERAAAEVLAGNGELREKLAEQVSADAAASLGDAFDLKPAIEAAALRTDSAVAYALSLLSASSN